MVGVLYSFSGERNNLGTKWRPGRKNLQVATAHMASHRHTLTQKHTDARTQTNSYTKNKTKKKQMNQIQTQTDVKWGRKTTGTNSATQADMSTQTSKQTVLGDS